MVVEPVVLALILLVMAAATSGRESLSSKIPAAARNRSFDHNQNYGVFLTITQNQDKLNNR